MANAPDPRLLDLQRALGGIVTHIRLNTNDRTLVSLRGSRREGIRLSLHHRLLDYPTALAELTGWIKANGRKPGPLLNHAIAEVFDRLAVERRANPVTIPLFEPLGAPLDLLAMYTQIHATWFPALSKPPIGWGPRRQGAERRRRIRFAAYHRRPNTRIIVNRLLDQPWVARDFVSYVLYHELCHHAQAMAPVRGEKPHSPRFKQWEARYPRFRELLLWEKAHVDRFLAARSDDGAG